MARLPEQSEKVYEFTTSFVFQDIKFGSRLMFDQFDLGLYAQPFLGLLGCWAMAEWKPFVRSVLISYG